MSSIFFIVLVAVIAVDNINASSNHKQTDGTADVQKTDKCEGRRDRLECPIHIANGFCSREGITDEQRLTFCPFGCGLCNKTESLQ